MEEMRESIRVGIEAGQLQRVDAVKSPER